MLSFVPLVVNASFVRYQICMKQQDYIGPRSRDLRRRLGLTLDDVAERAEISKGHLSRFERGEKSLSLAAMLRLAKSLETTVGVLVGEDLHENEVRLVRQGDVKPIQSDGGAYSYLPLSGAASTGAAHSTMIMEVPAGTPVTADAFHSGLELLYLLSGKIKIEIGKKEFELNAGDYLEFPGHIPHAIQSLGQDSRILLVVVE